jgi:hypothetical protein
MCGDIAGRFAFNDNTRLSKVPGTHQAPLNHQLSTLNPTQLLQSQSRSLGMREDA